MLKAYMVHDGDPQEHALLIFAEKARQARAMGHGVEDMGCEGWLTMVAKRRPDLDHHANQSAPKPYIADMATMRQAGWSSADYGSSCGCCGLHDFDMDKWAVCPECDHCPECGHMDDCPNKAAEAVRP